MLHVNMMFNPEIEWLDPDSVLTSYRREWSDHLAGFDGSSIL